MLEKPTPSSRLIKLSQNENPFGPSPKAMEAIREMVPHVFRYPDPFQRELTQKIAALQGVGADQIVLGAGSVELIDLCIKGLSQPGDNIVTAEVTFEGYKILATNNDRGVKFAPLRDYAIDLDVIRELCDERTRIVFIANPNNPTGTLLTHAQMVDFLDSLPDGIFVVSDEAYFEYVTHPDFPKSLELLRTHPNLVIFRTFSKIYGLAGLRLGYVITSQEAAVKIHRRRTPFSVGSMSAAAAFAALDDGEFVANCVKANREQRNFLYRSLLELGYQAKEPHGNFIFMDFQTIDEKDRFFDHLQSHNIFIRKLDNFGIHTALRITVGTPEDNRFLVNALQEL